jgi:hypothetical protein
LTNKILFSTILSLSLIGTLDAKNSLKDIACGEEFNTTSFATTTLIDENICKTIPIKQDIKRHMVRIDNYQNLFNILDIKHKSRLYHDKRVMKILNDFYINDYTLTYLFYKKVTNFKQKVEDSFKELTIDRDIIENVDLGGEYIGLLHIKTDAEESYQKIKKKVSKKLLQYEKLDRLKTLLTKIVPEDNIIIKEFSTEHPNLEKSTDLKSFLNNYQQFENNIIGENQPIAFHTTKVLKDDLSQLLHLYNQRNNLYYIKTHPKQFKLKDKILYTKAFAAIEKKLRFLKRDPNSENNITTKDIVLPTRYYKNVDIPPIKIDTFSYEVKSKNIQVDYPRIKEKSYFTFNLELQLAIKRHGKVIIKQIKSSLKEDETAIAVQQESQILLDTFVNYEKLKFHKIKNYTYGTLQVKLKFDKYEQEKRIQGFGLIKEATCGYKIDHNHALKFYCKNIILKPLDIAFLHDE